MLPAYQAIQYIPLSGTIVSLNCGTPTNVGSLYSGISASGVSSIISYTGGNGGRYNSQIITSTAVTGLTATLIAGTFANGSGTLTYTITGTPSASGTASFALSIGGQSCALSVAVAPVIGTFSAGTVNCTVATAVVDVINPTTGQIWMDRNLGAIQVATSSTDASSYGDLYQWGRRSDGHQCRTSLTTATLSTVDQPANGNFILAPNSPRDWRSPQNANLWQGVNGVNNPCPSGYRLPTETELNTERLSWITDNPAGAFASPLKLPMAGYRFYSNGSLLGVGTYGAYKSSMISGDDSRSLVFTTSTTTNPFTGQTSTINPYIFTSYQAYGGTVRCIKDASAIPPTVGALNCGSTSIIGTLTSGTAASGVSASVPYTSGNSGSYLAQSFSSTGVTGLTATLTSGNLANGSGSLSFAISGTPSTSGSAIFALTIGGQTCSFTISVQTALSEQYPANSVFCASGPTAIVDVINPTTGKIWMDRNLGALRAATSSTDTQAYGDLYQWGRRSDGHQCRNSATTSVVSNIDQPLHGNHIVVPNSPFDWRSPQNTNLWQGVNGVNNPCPSGYRLPTEIELNAERLSWSSNNSAGAFASPLKFTMAGGRHYNNNLSLVNVGTYGDYYSSTISSPNSRNLVFTNDTAYMNSDYRADGDSVRCIKDASAIPATVGALNCGSTSITGTLTNGIAAIDVSAFVPYTGGNGGSYLAQSVSSTGVTGLTAALTSGTLAYGSGSFSFAISGTPSASGTASFALTLGGESCSFTISVQTALAEQYPANSVFCASGPTAIVDVINPTTGKIWMDRNLGASRAAISSTDANAYGDLYQWGRGNDGHQCRNSATTTTLSSTDQPVNGNFILTSGTNINWRSPQNNNLWQGVSGVNNPCPSGYRLPTETELNAERTSWGNNSVSGAFASPLKLPVAGGRATDGGLFNFGTDGFYWSSSVNGVASFSLAFNSSVAYMDSSTRSRGVSVRCLKQGPIESLNCNGTTNNGALTVGVAASGVNSTVPYTGGNGGAHNGQTVTSTGVTGLTATLVSGTFANGSGSLTYNITGTPSSSGTASFALSIGGQSCTLSVTVAIATGTFPPGTVNCTTATAVVDVTTLTGKTWMDRNLGASRAATSSTDSQAYGDLYQWGRGADGHQCRNSANTTTLSSTDQPVNDNFIVSPAAPNDWRSPQNDNLWQGVNGVNNPCPIGYRLPTYAELDTERLSMISDNPAGAFASPLKLPLGGYRNDVSGTISGVGFMGFYFSSTINITVPRFLKFTTVYTKNTFSRADGLSIRCIKN